AADGRRLRRQVRSAQRLQRVSAGSGLLRPRSRSLPGGDAGLDARRGAALPRSGAARHPEHRAPRADGARRARLEDGGRLVSTIRTARDVKADRSRLPVPGASRALPFPAIAKSTLPNGMRVWTVRHVQVPLVAFTLLVRRGASSDPAGKDGLAAVTADMLDEGSGGRSGIEIHEALARLGAQFDTDIGSDATVASMTVLSRFAQPVLGLLSDIVARPALRDVDFARVRELRLHRLTQLRDMPGALADRAFLKLLCGPHPYGHSPIGSEASLASMTVDDVRAFHARAIRPPAATLIAVGDCEHDDIVRLAGEAFADWDGAGDAEVAAGNPALQAPAITVVPRPRAPQSELRIGQVAAPRNTPHHHAPVVAHTILG